jgi:uncharacterized protein YciI
MRFAYFYLMTNEPARAREVAPAHVSYWQGRDLRAYRGGPFGDRSGGLLIFEASSRAEADQLAAGDPFVTESLLQSSWLKEWLVE